MMLTALTIAIRVTVLLLTAAGVAWLLRRSSAATRHLVWSCALVASLLVPLVSLALPAWELPLITRPSFQVGEERTHVSEATALPVTDGVKAADAPSIAPAAGAARTAASTEAAPIDYARTLFLAWLAGLGIVMVRLVVGTTRMWWVARRARSVTPGRWLRVAERLASALRIRTRVVFLEGGAAAMPMTWGILTSRVLLPQTASEWPLARQRVVLLHELAHVKRRDCLAQVIAQVACAVYWFNPLAWFAASRLRVERERACDDLVLAAGTRGSVYADHLLEVARTMRPAMLPTWAAVAMAHRSQLEGRLMAILDPQVPRRFPTRRRSLALVASLGMLTLPIALITPVTKAADTVVPLQPGDMLNAPSDAPSPASSPQPAPSPGAGASVEPEDRGELPRASIRSRAGAIAAWDIAESEWAPPIANRMPAEAGQAGGVPGGVKGGVAGGVETEREDEGATRARRADPRAVAALVEALKDSDAGVRESAMHALASMRAPEALAPIRASLTDSNPSVREQAAFALGQYKDRGSVDALIGALQDASGDVRQQAVFALGQIRDPRAAAPLGRSLQDASAEVREQAAFALGQLRSADAIEPLGKALQDKSADVRQQAALALGEIRDRRAVDPLLGALKDESADVRQQAAFALGELRDPRATEALTRALKDANVEVRRNAAIALAQVSR